MKTSEPTKGDSVELKHQFSTSLHKNLSIGRFGCAVWFNWPNAFTVEEVDRFGAVKVGNGWYLKASYLPARPLWKRILFGERKWPQ